MIKIVSAAYHMNIGDSKSAKILHGYVNTITNKNVVTVGYEGSAFKTKEDIEKFCEGVETIIIGTGGCFHSANIGKVMFAYDPELYKYISCPLIIMSTGFNRDYDRFDFRNDWKESMHALFGRADLMGFRTEDDKEMAISLGADRKKTFTCPDPLLFIGSRIEQYDNYNVGVSLYTDRCKSIIEKELIKYDYNPIFINHDDTSFRFNQYANCSFTISKRFHGQVLSFAYHKPCFSIESNIKHRFVRRFLYASDMQHWTDNHLVTETFADELQKFIADKERMRYYIYTRTKELTELFSDFLLKVESIIND